MIGVEDCNGFFQGEYKTQNDQRGDSFNITPYYMNQDCKDKDCKIQFSQGVAYTQEGMAGVEISAAGVNDRYFSGLGFIFEFKRTMGTGEDVLYERAGTTRAKVSSFGSIARPSLDRGIFKNCVELFSFPASHIRKFFLFPAFVFSDK